MRRGKKMKSCCIVVAMRWEAASRTWETGSSLPAVRWPIVCRILYTRHRTNTHRTKARACSQNAPPSRRSSASSFSLRRPSSLSLVLYTYVYTWLARYVTLLCIRRVSQRTGDARTHRESSACRVASIRPREVFQISC